MKKVFKFLFFAVLITHASLAWAGRFQGEGLTGDPGISFIDGGLAYTNDDNVSHSNWEYIYNPPLGGRTFSWFNLEKDFTSLDPLDINIAVIPSGDTTEYIFIENIYNNTGIDWSDYHVVLGRGTGVDFQPLTELDTDYLGLDFDTPDKDPTPQFVYVDDLQADPLVKTAIFSNLDHQAHKLDFSNGIFASPNSKEAILAFSLDVPDLDEFSNGYNFTIRQYPTIPGSNGNGNVIPEPGTLSLLGLGLLGALKFRRRNK